VGCHHDTEENAMTTRLCLFVTVLALLVVGIAAAQLPLLDLMANNVIQKYQSATCEQLWEQRGKPKSQQEQELIQLLRGDPQVRATFINKIAAPVANKMFECGLIP
jgi:hypothetical protein